jgi:hypothetical protein
MCEFLLGIAVDLAIAEPVGPAAFATAMRLRGGELRTRIVQAMLLGELLLVPLPADVTARVEDYAACLGVTDEMIRSIRELANGSLKLALIDFERCGYFEHLRTQLERRISAPVTDAWEVVWDDNRLYQTWAALEDCPDGSLGQGVWSFTLHSTRLRISGPP